CVDGDARIAPIGMHIVGDLAAATASVAQHGAEVRVAPQRVAGGALDGHTGVVVRDRLVTTTVVDVIAGDRRATRNRLDAGGMEAHAGTALGIPIAIERLGLGVAGLHVAGGGFGEVVLEVGE